MTSGAPGSDVVRISVHYKCAVRNTQRGDQRGLLLSNGIMDLWAVDYFALTVG